MDISVNAFLDSGFRRNDNGAGMTPRNPRNPRNLRNLRTGITSKIIQKNLTKSIKSGKIACF